MFHGSSNKLGGGPDGSAPLTDQAAAREARARAAEARFNKA